MKVSNLRDILKDASLHPPKKLNPSLISDIHSKTSTLEDLDDILTSRFFHNIAWRFFHADVTNSHLELILQVAAYEYETLSRKTCLELIQKDSKKSNELISRILKSTMTYRKQDTRLQAAIFLFLRVLISASPSVLINHPIFAKWKDQAFAGYTETLQNFNSDSASCLLLHCFLSFCIACVVSSSPECKEVITEMCIPYRFLLESFDFKTRRLASLILLLNPTKISFTFFQNSIETLGFQGKFPSAEFAASRLDVSFENLLEELQNLSSTDLARLADHLGCPNSKILSEEVMLVMIAHLILNSDISYHRLQKCDLFNENDVFDMFDTDPPHLPFIPSPTIPSFVPFSRNWVDQIEARNAYKYLASVNERVENVLDRLTITDPSSERGIKGSSKYFSEIQALEIMGSKAQISLSNKKIVSIISTGDNVLLVEFQKPSRNGGVHRLIKHGVCSCSITKVISNSDKLIVEWNSTELEGRFNGLICLPGLVEKIQSYSEAALTDTLNDIFNNQETKPFKLSIDCLTESALESLGAELITKKRKIDNEQTGKDVSRYNLKNLEITIPQIDTSHSLSEGLASAFVSMFQQKSIVEASNGSERNRLINAFFRTLSLNQSKETCLIVLPTKQAVDLFELEDDRNTFKYDSNNLFLLSKIEKISNNIKKSAELSQHLGLEEYDFQSSIRNVLMLYYSHIEPGWKAFLRSLSEENVSSYPFASVQSLTLSEGLEAIVEHYSSIRSLFADLQDCIPLDKFNFQDLKQHDYAQIREFFAHKSQFLIVSTNDLPFVERGFDNIVVHDESAIPLLKGGFNRLTVIGKSSIKWGEHHKISIPENRQDIARLCGNDGFELKPAHNPGFRFCVQHIKVSSSRNNVNVEEAKLCVALYQYMRSLGYPLSKVSIGVKSEYMRHLVEEILIDEKIHKSEKPCDLPGSFSFGWPIIQSLNDVHPCDYLIVSCHGNPTWREYKSVADASRMGLYLVGSESDHPYKLRSGDLEVTKNEQYGSERTSQKHFAMKVEEFRNSVEELTRQKLGTKK